MPAIFPSLEDWTSKLRHPNHPTLLILLINHTQYGWDSRFFFGYMRSKQKQKSDPKKPQNSWPHHHFMILILMRSLKPTAISRPWKIGRESPKRNGSYSKKTWLSGAFAVSCRVYLWMQSDARKDRRDGFLVERSGKHGFFPDKVLDTWQRLNLKIINTCTEKSFELNLHEFGFKTLPSLKLAVHPWK